MDKQKQNQPNQAGRQNQQGQSQKGSQQQERYQQGRQGKQWQTNDPKKVKDSIEPSGSQEREENDNWDNVTD